MLRDILLQVNANLSPADPYDGRGEKNTSQLYGARVMFFTCLKYCFLHHYYNSRPIICVKDVDDIQFSDKPKS